MAVTNNVLNAINVFSSTSVFNSNKSSVGANDLNFIKQTTAELATEGGGIIAQSLGTNGYVKFANGLILQWGFATNSFNNSASIATVSYPIAFNVEPIVVTQKGDKNATSISDIGTNGWYNRQELVINVTTSGFKTAFYNRTGYSGCQWHAFGW